MNAPACVPATAVPSALLTALGGAPFAALLVDTDGRILYANPPLLAMFGYQAAELLLQTVEMLLPENERNAHARQREEQPRHYRTRAMGRGLNTVGLRRDGTSFALDIRLQSVDLEGRRLNIAFVAERQDQPDNQRELARLNRLLRLIHDCNAVLVRARDNRTLIDGIARSMASIGRYPLVWIGLLPCTASAFQSTACAGHQRECENCHLPVPYAAFAQRVVEARVPLRLGASELPTQAGQDLCPALAATQPFALMAWPLLTAEKVFGCLCVISTEENAFTGHEAELLQELADDLAFGLEAAHIRALRQMDETRLRLLERAVEASANAIVITDARDPQHPILYVNPAFERMTGYPAAEALGCNARFLIKDDWHQEALDEIRGALRERREAQALLRNYRKDGRLFWNELTVAPVRDAQGCVTHFVSLMNDFTERKLQEDLIEHHSHYDALTGLPNRYSLFGRIDQASMAAQDRGEALGVVLIALDRFALVNDAYGHDAGDALLRAVGARLLGVVRPRDTVARLGGDEFVVIVLGKLDLERVITVVDKLRTALMEPFELACGEVLISASIGVSFSPRDGLDAQSLIRNAEVAMLGAKTAGWNAVRYYAEDMNRRTGERLEMEFDLRRALERGDFEVHYQPIVEIDSGRIVEAEALLRWNRPQHGLVAPDSFIPLAETCGLIVPIGRWVLHEACRQSAAWRSAGLAPVALAVNLSARQFREPGLETLVAEALGEHGLNGNDLTLEVTESLLMTGIEMASDTLLRLKTLGVHIALDDFGTGYSSLAYLKRLPLDTLKIDRSFVRDISTDPNDAAITTTIISMARTLHLGVIAEGVESRGQLEHLRSNGCQRAQGYLFSRPLPAAQFATLLARGCPPVEQAASGFPA